MLILLLFSGVYFAVLFWTSRFFPKPAGEQNVTNKPASVQISVIIPFRNEEKNLLPLLGDLIRQNYPVTLFEIIFVDDHSEDKGPALLKMELGKSQHRITLLQAEGTGKKAALSTGIARAKGELIVTHDADCRLRPEILQNFAANYTQTGACLIAAPVVYQKPSKLSEHFFQIEFASAVGISALLFVANRPLMCNGAGLAFTKKAFDEVGGYAGNAHIPSGDDEFLLRKINRTFPGRTSYLFLADRAVKTALPENISAFFSQRIRWAGKWNSDFRSPTFWLAPLVFAFHFAFLPATVYALFSYESTLLLFLGALIGKIAAEFVFLSAVLRFLTGKNRPEFIPFASCVYPFYVTILVILVLFKKNYNWKGRRFSVNKSS